MRKQLSIDEIIEEKGKVYVAKIKLSVIRENTSSKRTQIGSPEDVARLGFIQSELVSSDREKFMCIHLNIKHVVLSYEIVSIGSLNSSIVHPRELLKGALLANAAAIIVGHNHPSGSPEPSPDDIAVTKRLVEAGSIIGIPILDHLIFGDQGFVSLKEREVM
jgi:DNA repair protein RadC